MIEFATEQSEIFPDDCEMGQFLRSVIPAIEEFEKENKALQNRCYAVTGGTLCLFCPIDCDHRSTKFRGNENNG